jgi:hypothetical protein
MLCKKLCLFTLLFSLAQIASFAEDGVYYFVNENLKLRENQDLSNDTITIMPAGTQLELIESGYYEVIDGIRDQWQKVRMEDGTEGWCYGGYLAKLVVNNGVLTYCSGKNSTLNIPDNLGITSIGENVFLKNEKIREITIPVGVIKIEDSAFQESSVERVNLPEGLIEIGNEVFYKCWRLKTLVLPQSLEKIGDGAFSWNNLESVNIPPHVTHLGNSVFDISNIKSLFIPASVVSIGRSTFLCETLQEIVVDEANPVYTSREGVLFSKDLMTLVAYPPGAVRDVYRVPESTTSILSSAFGRCRSTSEVVIPEGMKEIFSNAFWSAKSLQSINIPPGTILGDQAFNGCEKLMDVTIPEGMKKIPAGLFANCSKLTTVQLPETLESINDGAFSNCSSLRTISLPETLNYMGERAFSGCSSLEEVCIPDNIKSINAATFAFCTNLSGLYFGSKDSSLSSIENGSWSASDPLEIFGGAFKACTSLESVIFPDYIVFRHKTRYGYQAFEDCTALKEVYISREINLHDAFDGCPVQFLYTD